MFYALTHKQAKQKHPKEYSELVSKYKGKTPFALAKIGYDMCELIESVGFGNFLMGEKPKEKTLDENLASFRKNAKVSLVCKSCYVNIPEVPESFVEERRKSLEKDETERKRFKSLTPAEQNKETTDLLRQLAGPGFACFNPDSNMEDLCKKTGVKILKGGRK